MNKIILSSFLVLAIIGTVAFVATLPIHNTGSIANSVLPKTNLTAIPQANPVSPSNFNDRKKLAFAKIDASMARLSSKSTPEQEEVILRISYAKCKTAYTAFFETLDLPGDTTTEALAVILERERNKLSAFHALIHKGFTNGIDEHSETRKLESYLAEIQLRELLGSTDYKKLIEFETSLGRANFSNAQLIVSKLLND